MTAVVSSHFSNSVDNRLLCGVVASAIPLTFKGLNLGGSFRFFIPFSQGEGFP